MCNCYYWHFVVIIDGVERLASFRHDGCVTYKDAYYEVRRFFPVVREASIEDIDAHLIIPIT